MQFNKLYKIILESIITEDIQSKIKKAIQTLIKSGQIKDQNDLRVEQVKTIIKRNNSIDINGKTDLDQLLKQNKMLLNREQVKKDNYLDSIPQFSQKQEFGNGEVVIYRVQDSPEALKAVRKIIDTQLGYGSNPWCLVTRTEDGKLDQAWSFWNECYAGYPKHIAFQNGKLFALCANRDEKNLWWNLKNKESQALFTPNWHLVEPPTYAWTKEDKAQKFIKDHNLIYNEQTKRYDSNQTKSFYVRDNELLDGHFPVPLGVFKCDYFGCTNNDHLTSLINAPTEIAGDFNIGECRYLRTLKGGPIKVGGSYWCDKCRILDDLTGAPKYVGKSMWMNQLKFLESLKGMQNTVIGEDFNCAHNLELKSLVGGPKEVGRNYNILVCYNVQSFKGLPEKIGGYIVCNETWQLRRYKNNQEFLKKYRVKFYEL